MRVFISWSGPRSLAVAEALRDWLPNVLQNVEPFLSQEDIRAGQHWLEVIGTQLEETDFGICCIDPTKQAAPWLVFEAGALAKKLNQGRVVAYLIDMQPTDLTGPLTQFQNVVCDKAGTEKLIMSLNESTEKGGLSKDRAASIFEKWWEDLEAKLGSLPDEKEPVPAARSDSDKLDEILLLLRRSAVAAEPHSHFGPFRPNIIIGGNSLDYFDIRCAECDTQTKNEYLGRDPVMPLFKTTCPGCGKTGRFKMHAHLWSGLPHDPES